MKKNAHFKFALAAALALLALAQPFAKKSAQKNSSPKKCKVNLQKIFFPKTLPQNEALEFVASMGLGINIGNTLDCITDKDGPGTDETSWGNPRITREYIRALKNYGYKTIRLPVTWAEHTDLQNDFAIDPKWMARVSEVVDWCLEEDLFAIVNLHHDGGTSKTSWILGAADDYENVSRRFERTWQQIAKNFSDYDERLIFEAMNEVGFDDAGPRGYKVMNSLNQLFVDTIRKSGQKNSSRYLMFSGYWTDIEKSCKKEFKIPKDEISNRLILSVHYYTPSSFTISSDTKNEWWYRYDWGAFDDVTELNANFKMLYDNFVQKGVPVVVGEFGMIHEKESRSRSAWLASVMRACQNQKMCCALWDPGHEISRHPPYEMGQTLSCALDFVKAAQAAQDN